MEIEGERRDTLRAMLAADSGGQLKDEQFLGFVELCESRGLDPFARQVHATFRAGKLVPIVGIDGMRAIASRTGKYRGQRGPHWCGEDGKWLDVWLSAKPPLAARVEVLHGDFTEPMTGTALMREYQQRSGMWGTLPTVMIAKVAEAIALRRAFPDSLSGLYTGDEIKDVHPATPARLPARAPQLPTSTLTEFAAWVDGLEAIPDAAELRERGASLPDSAKAQARAIYTSRIEQLKNNTAALPPPSTESESEQ